VPKIIADRHFFSIQIPVTGREEFLYVRQKVAGHKKFVTCCKEITKIKREKGITRNYSTESKVKFNDLC
jgi:hypothetical protein